MMARKYGRLFAAYKGDRFIVLGTADEVAKYLGIAVKNIYSYASPSHIKRAERHGGIYAIKVEL